MQKPLRIAFSAGTFRNLGTYWRAYFLGRELAKQGHDVTLFCIAPGSRFRSRQAISDGVRIIECPNVLNRPFVSHGLGPLDIARRAVALWGTRFDIVHGFEYYADVTLPVWITQPFKGYVYVSDWCDWFCQGIQYGRFGRFPSVARFVGWLEDNARRTAAGVTVISRRLERHVRELGFSPEQILYLPGGAPVDRIRPQPKEKVRRKLGLDPSLKIVGYLASTYAPGIEQWAEQIAKLCTQIPELRFLMLGRPYQPFIQMMTQLGMQDRLIVTGWVEEIDLPDYLAAADVFVLPLKADGYNQSRWPQKLGEYLAAGRPVVGNNVGDVGQLLADGGAGYVVDGHQDEIRQAVLAILMNAARAEIMGNQARQIAEERLAWSRLASELESFYYQLMATHRA